MKAHWHQCKDCEAKVLCFRPAVHEVRCPACKQATVTT